MTEMIVLTHLTKHFGPLKAVDGINMSVAKGEVLGFLGPNGAGKSTTMKMITGFLTPTDGEARVDGIDVVQDPVAAKRRLGYLPEGAPCYGDMTPLSFLGFIAEVRGLSGAERRRAIDQAGFKRRVGLAQAILHNPPVLILDEPTDGLDPNQKHQVRDLIHQMAEDKAVVISTHILEEVEAVCTRAVIIARGKLLADGTPEELVRRSPLHNAVHLDVASNIVDAVIRDIEALAGVGSVRRDSSFSVKATLIVTSKSGAPIAPALAALLQDKGHDVSDFKTEKGALDAVFREITRGPDRNAASGDAGHA
mgnify:CR=1 FL=1